MLRSLFLYVRQKPKAVRDQIALAISSVFTGLVALVWIVGQVDRPEPTLSTDNMVESPEYEKPFAGLFNQVKQQLAAVRESVDAATATSTATVATTTEVVAGSVLEMTLSPETIASTSALIPEPSTTTSTTTASAATSTSSTTVSQPVPTEPYRVIQIATTSKSVATTTPPLY